MTDADADNAASSPTASQPLAGRKILVALSGGIACYKTATLVSRLVQHGATVRVLMTESATHFVTPLTFQSLSGSPVITSIWQHDDHPDSQHIGLARWCDLLVIAPATANLIGRIAHGLADDVVTLVACALPAPTPVLFCPAMNSDMWQNPLVQQNVQNLRDLLGWQMVGPDEGWQACRTAGPGRMSQPERIFDVTLETLNR